MSIKFVYNYCSVIYREDGNNVEETYRLYGGLNHITGKSYHVFDISVEEHNRFQKEKTFPIISLNGSRVWLNKDGFFHRIDGPSVIYENESNYYLNGNYFNFKEYEIARKKEKVKFNFSYNVCQALSMMIEIPELYDEIYYKHKNDFLSLLNKV